jgi:hypothetical protein
MTEIILGNSSLVAIIDDHDFTFVHGYNWSAHKGRNTWYAVTRHGPRADRRFLFLHRLITGYDGADHIDGHGLNNRRSNLRRATVSQNQANRPQVNGIFKGVHQLKSNGLWQAAVKVNRKKIFLGSYATAEDAARAYDSAATEAFGEFAHLNFPKG